MFEIFLEFQIVLSDSTAFLPFNVWVKINDDLFPGSVIAWKHSGVLHFQQDRSDIELY